MNKVEANHQLLKALSKLERLHPKKIDLGLGRIERVLKKLGNPHTKNFLKLYMLREQMGKVQQ